MNNKIELLKEKINLLKQKDKDCVLFGAQAHRYQLNACLTKKQVANFEQQYKITLPEDYRSFLLHIGNGGSGRYGGAGPCYGILSLEKSLAEIKIEIKNFGLNFLSEPFPLKESDALDCIHKRNRELPFYFIDEDYPLCGSLPICHQGCGWMYVLVVSGEQKGKIWTAGEGWCPFYYEDNQIDFLTWYEDWLDSSLADILGK
ncbi:SMI1/KNR4 family protein [Microcoleus sp. ZQ-A2]|nr:SMI1/KNR4 family protein [Microcoleus sp. FACHB-1]